MTIYTIGFTQKTAQQFFELIRTNGITLLIDVRLNNISQLAGFSKGNDLKYFLSELCGCDYLHCADFAPTKKLLDDYKDKKISWPAYEEQYSALIMSRNSISGFFERYGNYEKICLLCSEPTATNCHRRLLAEMIINEYPQIALKHI